MLPFAPPLSLNHQVEQLTADVNAERSNLQKAENARMALERSNKEMKAKLSEMEAQMRTRSKATIASLESKIVNLEDQLDMEARCVTAIRHSTAITNH